MDTKLQRQSIKQIHIKKINLMPADNVKVKVQYIQNHKQIVDRTAKLIPMQIDAESEDVENAEYLDDSEEYKTVAEEFKDTFYENAIQCLLALYRSKYQLLQNKSAAEIKAMQIWEQIAGEMNECYFDFTSVQIKQKYRQLRQQYFNISTVDEIHGFDYFEQLHEIYHDKFVQAIATADTDAAQSKQQQQLVLYADEPLMHDVDESMEHIMPTQAAEIAHKEHELIDMVEKEFQAMDADSETIVTTALPSPLAQTLQEEKLESNEIIHHQENIVSHNNTSNAKSTSCLPQNVLIKREQQDEDATETLPFKRFKLDVNKSNTIITVPTSVLSRPHIKVNALHVQQPQQHHIRTSPIITTPSPASTTAQQTEFSLASYNEQQERRHQEKMELLRQSLKLQQRNVELQFQLLEQLIKRT